MIRNRFASRMSEFHKLDLASFENDWFESRRAGRVTWSRGEIETGSIGYALSPHEVELRYASGRGDKKQSVVDLIPLAFTDQPFGGRRRWFTCKACQRRCRVLIGGTYFRCRQCYGATYESQYETYRAHGLAKAETMRKRLGAEPGIANPLPSKPKGMHWRTYRTIEAANWNAMVQLDRMLSGVT